MIQALDTLNDRRTTGGDRFAVRVVSTDGKVEGEAVVQDLADGKYEVQYSVPVPGSYLVHVSHADLGGTDAIPVWGSPFKVTAADPWTKHRLLGSTPAAAKVGAQHWVLLL
jgi:dynein heavy chain